MRSCGLFAYAGYLLVAPVKIGKGACIGSGSVITKDVDAAAPLRRPPSPFCRDGRARKSSNLMLLLHHTGRQIDL